MPMLVPMDADADANADTSADANVNVNCLVRVVLCLFHIYLSRLSTSCYIYYTNGSNLRVSTYHAYAHPTSIIPTVTFGYPYGSGMVSVW